MDKIYGFLSNEELNKWEKLPVVVNILTSKEFGSWLLRRDENRDKQNNSRPHGEITDEDIQNAIKQGYNDGYEMANAKYERPQGECEKCTYRIFTEKFSDSIAEVMTLYGITSIEELQARLQEEMRGGAE